MRASNRIRSASPEMIQAAKQLRANSTPAESKLWLALSNRQLAGLRFRRQHAFENFVFDLYCPACKPVIEVDGGIHEELEVAERDTERNNYLHMRGLFVLRFTNAEVLNHLPSVLQRIREVATPTDRPID